MRERYTIWLMNEEMATTVPKFLLHATGKRYMNGFRKKAATYVELQQQGRLHPYNWRVTYREISENTLSWTSPNAQ